MVINVMVAVDSGSPCRRAVRTRAPRLATGVLCDVKIDGAFRLCLVRSASAQLVEVLRVAQSPAYAPTQSPAAVTAGIVSWRRLVLDIARLFAKNVTSMAGLTR